MAIDVVKRVDVDDGYVGEISSALDQVTELVRRLGFECLSYRAVFCTEGSLLITVNFRHTEKQPLEWTTCIPSASETRPSQAEVVKVLSEGIPKRIRT